MEFVKDRSIKEGQKVKCYVNLNQQGKFSIVDAKSGLVCAYARRVLLKDVHFHVSPSGRRKTIQNQRRSVHAWCRGILVSWEEDRPGICSEKVNYNPFQHEGFIVEETGEPVQNADWAHFENKRVYIPKEQ